MLLVPCRARDPFDAAEQAEWHLDNIDFDQVQRPLSMLFAEGEKES